MVRKLYIRIIKLYELEEVPPINEKELLSLLKQGDEVAFEKIYHLYSSRLFGKIFSLVKSVHVTQEILQDVFLKVWHNRGRLDTDQSFRSYIFKIAENNVYDFFRRATRERALAARLFAEATEHFDHIEQKLNNKEFTEILQKAVATLPHQRKQIFVMCKQEGRSYSEVSRLLGITESTISDHIVKANKTIREYLYNNADLSRLLIIIFLLTENLIAN